MNTPPTAITVNHTDVNTQHKNAGNVPTTDTPSSTSSTAGTERGTFEISVSHDVETSTVDTIRTERRCPTH